MAVLRLRPGGEPGSVSPADRVIDARAADERPDGGVLAGACPDGRTVAFHSKRGPSRDVYLSPLDGGALRRVTDSPVLEEGVPRWSPDGRQPALLTVTAPGELLISSPDGRGGWTTRPFVCARQLGELVARRQMMRLCHRPPRWRAARVAVDSLAPARSTTRPPPGRRRPRTARGARTAGRLLPTAHGADGKVLIMRSLPRAARRAR